MRQYPYETVESQAHIRSVRIRFVRRSSVLEYISSNNIVHGVQIDGSFRIVDISAHVAKDVVLNQRPSSSADRGHATSPVVLEYVVSHYCICRILSIIFHDINVVVASSSEHVVLDQAMRAALDRHVSSSLCPQNVSLLVV
jgi:hypothetical protein